MKLLIYFNYQFSWLLSLHNVLHFNIYGLHNVILNFIPFIYDMIKNFKNQSLNDLTIPII